MASIVKRTTKTVTKRNRSAAKGTASRRKTTIHNKKGNVNVAMVGKARKK